MQDMDRMIGAIWMFLIVVVVWLAHGIGYEAGRQSVEAVACEPSVVGLRKNGKEIPLTSAQRDSLARAR